VKKNPAISVIVPVYNVEIYIRQCVDSILKQTFQDFEIILVNDATPDKSFELCKKFYGGNKKVRFFNHEKNLGLGEARNTGMRHARGKYICFVDSDDTILPVALEKFYTAAEKTNAQVVHASGWYELHQDAPEPVLQENLKLSWERHNQEGFLPFNVPYRLDRNWKMMDTWSMAWLCFCRRDFLAENKIEFLPILSEDEPFAFALYCLAERYYVIHEALYIYRRRSGSIMQSTNIDKFSKGINALITAPIYLEKFLDRVPKFPNYDAWREGIISTCFIRFSPHTSPFYRDLNLTLEKISIVEKALAPFFGKNTAFVKFFFNHYNLNHWQAEKLQNRNNQLSAQMMSLFGRIEISPTKIVFNNFLGKGYGCNPKYIAEEILRQNLPYDLVWLVRDLNEPMPAKIRKVLYGSVDSIYEVATAKVIVSNVKNLLPYPNKKQGQYFIMTWHGACSFKPVEKDAENKLSPAYVRESKINSQMTDLMMAGSQDQFDEFRRAFWYNGEILKCGIPRNDIFFNHDTEIISRIRKTLNVPDGNRIIIFAPTFRDNPAILADVYKFDAKRLLEIMRKKFGGSWTLLIRLHPNISYLNANDFFGDSENIINVTNYPDMQELIVVSDVLISDYSSLIYDFMVSHKPVFIYAKDFDTYPKERGFKQLYFDLPYKINRTEDELFSCIKTFDFKALEPTIKNFLDVVKPFDTGHASEEVVKRIKAVIENKPVTLNETNAQEKQPQEDIFSKLLTNPIFKNNIDLLTKIPIQEKDAQNILQTLGFVEDKYYYELMDTRPFKPKILDVSSGIKKLISSGKSFCRLGDGEVKLMNGINLDFQQYDKMLAEKLLQILQDEQTNCYVGINRYYWYFRDDIERNANPYHRRYYTFQIPPIRKFFAEHCNKNKTYIDSCLGGYMSNKSLAFCEERFNQLKKLFQNRKLLIVAGETVFNNITYDFFDVATQKEFLFAPRVNAWSQFDSIMEKILTYPKDFLITLILGPTATVLAYELSKLGYTAYDIGHVPKDYDAFRKNADRSAGAIAKFYAAD